MKNEFILAFDAAMGLKSIGFLAKSVEAMEFLYPSSRFTHAFRAALECRLTNQK